MEALGTTYNTPRRSLRAKVNVPVKLVLEYRGQVILRESTMLDLSNQGIRVVATPEFITGQIVQVIPNEGPRFAEKARIVWVSPPDSVPERQAGLEFLGPHASSL
jgi:hypothetical protein